MLEGSEAIRSGMSLRQIRQSFEATLLNLGAEDFWYWDIGAFIFAGDETVQSVSGKEYETPDRVVKETDLITVDLSPRKDGLWGDYARTIVIEGGRALPDPLMSSNASWVEGIRAEHELHACLVDFAEPSMTFEQLHQVMSKQVSDLGFENLDFLGNLGHSIERHRDDRTYIEAGNPARLDTVEFFTFEPHIRRIGDHYGYKHEDIYHFVSGHLVAL